MAQKKAPTKANGAKKRSRSTPKAFDVLSTASLAGSDLVCERCGHHNLPDSAECAFCQSK